MALQINRGNHTMNNKTVLLVDDEQRNVFALSSYLQAQDMDVIVAENGEQALAMIKEYNPGIVLLDMLMPVMDGSDTLAAMKQNGDLERIPVIAVTAKAMKGDREKCLEAGAWDYVSKPVELKSLLEKMNELMK